MQLFGTRTGFSGRSEIFLTVKLQLMLLFVGCLTTYAADFVVTHDILLTLFWSSLINALID
jgi:hypothetical protein